MKIRGVSAKTILNSRQEKTILVSIKTNVGSFSASSPTGKSIGKYEKKAYKKSLEEDVKLIKNFSDYFSEEAIEKFEDLRRIEDIVGGHIGANTLFALESAVLKAIANEQKKEVWQIINPEAKKLPKLVGNCVGGGKHSDSEKKPDFQEFLLIPKSKSVIKSFEINKKQKAEPLVASSLVSLSKAKKDTEEILGRADKNFERKKNDEDAWVTSLNERQILDILRKLKLPLGIDVASSSFYKRKKYHYQNPKLDRTNDEQLGYLVNLIKNFDLFYIEDGFEEEDFESFAKLLKKFPDRLIVGDDLTVTNYERLEKAIKIKAVNGLIVKPNQCGSLLEVKRVCELAKKNNIKIVFSHRSGETEEDILADLAFGFSADFFKCGIDGKEREVKLKRLIEIEKNLKM